MRKLISSFNIVGCIFLLTTVNEVSAVSSARTGQDSNHVFANEKKLHHDAGEEVNNQLTMSSSSPVQRLPKSAAPLEHHNSKHSNISDSDTRSSRSGAMPAEGANNTDQFESTNYIKKPRKINIPLHQYTSLGNRLRFGSNNSTVRDGNGNGQSALRNAKKDPKTNQTSNNVWERIQLGMNILGPSSVQEIPTSVLHQKANGLTHDEGNPYSISDPQNEEAAAFAAEASFSDNVTEKQFIESNYIIKPHTAVAPKHNYTALGLRLRFGKKNPAAAANEDCNPAVDDRSQPEPNGVLIAPVNGILPGEAIKSSSDSKITSSGKPCGKKGSKISIAEQKQQAEQIEIPVQKTTAKALVDERINKQLKFFIQNPDYLNRVAQRATPYLYHIVEQLARNQLPLDLALLPIVESAYQPTVLSYKGAAGLWQFIPSTGKDYNLRQSDHYDDRLDLIASTRAAIRFLSDLKKHYNGDWLLALAAYNSGQGTVDHAISRNLSHGLNTDYWSLHLPEETQNYVPRLLALTKIFANPLAYGLKFPQIKNEPYFVRVSVDNEADKKYLSNKQIAVLAKLVNLSHEQFKRLNPGYLNSKISSEGPYTFLLPQENAAKLRSLFSSITEIM